MNKFFSVILIIACFMQISALPASAVEYPETEIYHLVEGEASEYGYIDYKYVDENGNEFEIAADEEYEEFCEEPLYYSSFIPSSYDLRDYGYVSSVKYQGAAGICWAFACVGALESNSLMRENSKPSETDFSETHLVWFSKNSKSTDENDMNYGEGFTNENPYTGSDCGGNEGYVTAALARWSGLAKETDYPFHPFRYDAYSTIGNYAESTRYDKGSGVVIKSAENLTDATDVKQWIMENGAVAASYYTNDDYYSEPAYAYNYNEEKAPNHMITIVGWDDNYSVDNFLVDYAPENNGAWLCKNSWSSSYWGLDGYFWISYEDKTLCDFVGFTTQKAEDFVNNYCYNGRNYRSILSGTSTPCFSNVFKAKDYEVVSDVATYMLQPDTNLKISIYKNIIDGYTNPTEGTLAITWESYVENTGYHTIDVPRNVYIEPGETFSVVVEIHGPDNKYCIPIEGRAIDGYVYNQGESFWNAKGTWRDISYYKFYSNFYLQALTKSIPENEASVYMNFKNNLIITPTNDFEQLKDISGIFNGGFYSVKDSNENLINYLATGSTLTVAPENGQAVDYTVVVAGDTNGDGVCDVLDASQAERIANNNYEPSELQIYAANGCVSETVDMSSYQNVVNTALLS